MPWKPIQHYYLQYPVKARQPLTAGIRKAFEVEHLVGNSDYL